MISNVCYNIMIDYVLLLQSLLVLVLDLEERLTILDADLRDDRNRSEDFAMARQVMAVGVLEDLPRLETSVDRLVAVPCAGLHSLVGDGVARVVRALDLVGGADVAVVGLDALALLEEVAEDLVKNCNIIKASGWVGTLDPYQVPPYNTYPDLVAEGGLPRVLVGGEGVPRLRLSCLRDPEIGPIDGHQAVVAHVI